MKLDRAIGDCQEAETELAQELRTIGERHAVEHDLYHLAHTLARQCEEHLDRLRPFAAHYGADPSEPDVAGSPTLIERMRHKTSELLGRSELTGLLLLRDLRSAYLQAHEAEICWVILAQSAQAARDRELLTVASEIHENSEKRWKWLRTRIKESAPQILVAG
jgi:hypothetical protein